MQHIIVNPSWYVPQSIIQNELLPLYASDPQIFDRMGLEVKQGPDGHINVVQPPGAANALGRIKFAFPNKFQVYLHDTPEKKLFAYDKRAFSHGCMRVRGPDQIRRGDAVAGDGRPDAERAAASTRMFGQDEKTYNLQKQPMVHLTYQTVFVDEAGKMHCRRGPLRLRRPHPLDPAQRRAPRRRRRAAAGSQARRCDRQGNQESCAASSAAKRRTRSRSSTSCSGKRGQQRRAALVDASESPRSDRRGGSPLTLFLTAPLRLRLHKGRGHVRPCMRSR